MCTGNLRSGTDALFQSFSGADPDGWKKALHYYGIIGCFIFGAASGAVLLTHFGEIVFLLAPLGLIVVLLLIMSQRQRVHLRKIRRRIYRGRKHL